MNASARATKSTCLRVADVGFRKFGVLPKSATTRVGPNIEKYQPLRKQTSEMDAKKTQNKKKHTLKLYGRSNI